MGRNRSGDGNRYEGFNEYTQKQIRIVASRVARSYGFKQHEQLDIEQELAMHLRSKLPSYDANRASVRTFVERVLEHKAIDLITERRARKRGACVTTLSLDDLDEDGTSSIRSNTLLDPTTIALEDFLNLRMDVERIVTSLPSDLRKLCVHLLTCNVTEIARTTGASRSAVYGSIHKLREAFADLDPRRGH